MVDVRIDVSELNTLAATIDSGDDRVRRQAELIIKKTEGAVIADAQAFAPVDTGNLRSSITGSILADGLEVEVGPTAAYGRYVEEGTSRMAPRAFMGPAFDRAQPGFVAAVEALGDEILD